MTEPIELYPTGLYIRNNGVLPRVDYMNNALLIMHLVMDRATDRHLVAVTLVRE